MENSNCSNNQIPGTGSVSKDMPDFFHTLKAHNLKLLKEDCETCQINMGLLCNQVCKHCHLAAGPLRKEVMELETVKQVIAFQEKFRFEVVDITGGAPEMNPNLPYLIKEMSKLTKRVMLRSNLSALYETEDSSLLDTLIKNKTVVVSSLPSLNQSQTDSQRGKNVFEKSIKALVMLNKYGYGKPCSGLELNLVSNPSGAFMPPSQKAAEKRYKELLFRKWGIVFNNFFTFVNTPLGRFEAWLKQSGNYDKYIETLFKGFNPCTIPGLMCKNLVSISWNGYLFDCDFNLAANLYMGNVKTHISDVQEGSFKDREIAVANHCYACTAGSGFT